MAISNGGEERRPPITEQLGNDRLTIANNLWGSVLAQKEYLLGAVPTATDDDLKMTNKWLQQTPQERATDPRFATLDKKFREGLQQMAENTAKVTEYFIRQAIRKETGPKETVEATIDAMRGYFVGELHALARDSVASLLAEDPVVFLKEEVSRLTDRVIRNSTEVTWRNISNYLRTMNATEPGLALVKDTYEKLLIDFSRGYDVQIQKNHRAETRGK